MYLFNIVLYKIIPLYLIILIGYIGTKLFKIDRETIGKTLIYILAPIIVFYGAFTTEISFTTLSLPILFFFICCYVSILFFIIGKFVYKEDATKNILAFASGSGNAGYFGLPVIATILGDKEFAISVMLILGVILYENTLGFYITARGGYSKYESIRKVVRLPSIYAFFIGIILNILNLELSNNVVLVIEHFKSAYVVFGMMLIGMGLIGIKLKNFDLKFILLTFFAKFFIFPLIILFIIFIDTNFFNIYNREIYNILIIMSIVPLAANTVAFATELKVYPEKAAIAVLLSTIFALFYIPLVLTLFTKFIV